MPRKNSIGAVLFLSGLFLSGSIWATLWLISPNGLFENVTITLHDTYIILHPFFILAGIFTVSFNIYLIVLQLFKQFKIINWNIAHVTSLALVSGFLFYGREVLRFGFAFIGRRLDYPNHAWFSNDELSVKGHAYTPGKWEKFSQNLPEIFLTAIGVFVLLLLIRTIRIQQKTYKSTL